MPNNPLHRQGEGRRADGTAVYVPPPTTIRQRLNRAAGVVRGDFRAPAGDLTPADRALIDNLPHDWADPEDKW